MAKSKEQKKGAKVEGLYMVQAGDVLVPLTDEIYRELYCQGVCQTGPEPLDFGEQEISRNLPSHTRR